MGKLFDKASSGADRIPLQDTSTGSCRGKALGRNTKPDTDIDDRVMKTGSFDPWGLQQIQWLYKERQPLK